MNEQVSSGGSVYIRALIKDCAGTLVTQASVSAIKLNIFEFLDTSTHVDGYYDLSLPVSSILATAQTDCDGNQYNFECNPFHDSKPMFPKRQETYVVEVVWYDLNGKPTANSKFVDSI